MGLYQIWYGSDDKMPEMKTVCPSCGNKHPFGTKPCRSRRAPKRHSTADRLRRTYRWRIKSEQIRERDKYLCQMCLTNRYDTVQQYTYSNLSVHHIIPLAEDMRRAFDDDNLITVCDYHHRLAESGKIPRRSLVSIITSTPPP